MKDKSLLLIQPGAFGDILLCAPIAKAYYDAGYRIYWPVVKKFYRTVEQLSYVIPVLLDDRVLDSDWLRSDVLKCLEYSKGRAFDIILNLADRGPHPTANLPFENFEQCKYRLANIPIIQKHTIHWTRSREREDALYTKVVFEEPYILAHLTSSKGDKADMPLTVKYPVVEVQEFAEYTVYDWYKVVLNAKEIYCVESSMHQFIDGLIEATTTIPKYILSRSTLGTLQRYTYSPYWDTTFLI